ncbi:hypothetical protein VTI74DRAFT_9300 [Chaetomium olivicolor]
MPATGTACACQSAGYGPAPNILGIGPTLTQTQGLHGIVGLHWKGASAPIRQRWLSPDPNVVPSDNHVQGTTGVSEVGIRRESTTDVPSLASSERRHRGTTPTISNHRMLTSVHGQENPACHANLVPPRPSYPTKSRSSKASPSAEHQGPRGIWLAIGIACSLRRAGDDPTQ